jgi:hypothetical protein
MRSFKTKPPQGAKSHPGTLPPKIFSLDEVQKFIDPGPAKEGEDFVQLIYEERRQDGERTSPE